MFERLEEMRRRFEEIERWLASPDAARDPAAFQRKARERGQLSRTVGPYLALLSVREELKSASEMAAKESDAEMAALAREEVARLRDEEKKRLAEVETLFLTDDPNDGRDILVEIRAGTGGEEAALFAADLCRMYQRYAERRGWKAEVLDAAASDLKGYRAVVLGIRGPDAWRELQYESGGHRVQRVPETEQAGRIHTSAATVAVMPEAEEVDFVIRPDDLKIDTFRAGGKGGQHVNKTESAVRITHIPTGVVVSMQDERSQHKNREKAMRILRARLYEAHEQKQKAAADATRKGLIGSGGRNDRIRTYNFPQNRFTDHRIGLSLYRLEQVMDGDFAEVVKALAEYDRKLRLGLPVEKGKDVED